MKTEKASRHVISVLVENRFGVLARIAGLFSGRGFNIASLSVGETKDATVSRMTIVVDDQGNPQIMEQVEKQLNKLIDVIKIQDMTGEEHIDRELVLIKVATTRSTRAEILEIAGVFRAKAVHVDHSSLVLEASGDEMKIRALIELMGRYGIREMVRSGRIAIGRA